MTGRARSHLLIRSYASYILHVSSITLCDTLHIFCMVRLGSAVTKHQQDFPLLSPSQTTKPDKLCADFRQCHHNSSLRNFIPQSLSQTMNSNIIGGSTLTQVIWSFQYWTSIQSMNMKMTHIQQHIPIPNSNEKSQKVFNTTDHTTRNKLTLEG